MRWSTLSAAVTRGLLAAVLIVGVPGWAQKSKPAPPSSPPADPAIAYVAFRSWAHTDLMVMNADGTNQKVLLSRDTGGYFDPTWSPDSSRIAYCATVPGSNGIYLMNKDGSGACKVVAMTNDCLTAGDPQWSPDGLKILYMDYVSEPTVNSELFLVDAACSADAGKTNLTNTPDVEEYEPAWSFDGTRIATVAYTSGTGPDLFLYQVEQQVGQDSWRVVSRVNLTANGPFSGQCCLKPNWSQSSSDRLAISTDDIYVVDVTDPFHPTFTNLTPTSDVREAFPGWSPYDQQIVHAHDRGIWVMNADGSNDQQLVAPSKTDRWTRLQAPDWRRTP